MTSIAYKKTDEAIAKGKRLRKLVKKTGLTQAEFAEKMGLSLNTFNYYLHGRFHGLTEDATDDVVKIAAELGHPTTKEWLLYGLEKSEDELIQSDIINEVQDELRLFFQKNPRAAVHALIKDSRMEPVIPKGSLVAGIRIDLDALFNYYSRVMIVGTANFETHVGVLAPYQETNAIQLTYLNEDYESETTLLPLKQIIYAAPLYRLFTTYPLLVNT